MTTWGKTARNTAGGGATSPTVRDGSSSLWIYELRGCGVLTRACSIRGLSVESEKPSSNASSRSLLPRSGVFTSPPANTINAPAGERRLRLASRRLTAGGSSVFSQLLKATSGTSQKQQCQRLPRHNKCHTVSCARKETRERHSHQRPSRLRCNGRSPVLDAEKLGERAVVSAASLFSVLIVSGAVAQHSNAKGRFGPVGMNTAGGSTPLIRMVSAPM